MADDGVERAEVNGDGRDRTCMRDDGGQPSGRVSVARNVEGDDAEAAPHERLCEVGELRAAPLPPVDQQDGRRARPPAPGGELLAVVGDRQALRSRERLRLPGGTTMATRREEEAFGVARGEGRGVRADHAQAGAGRADREWQPRRLAC